MKALNPEGMSPFSFSGRIIAAAAAATVLANSLTVMIVKLSGALWLSWSLGTLLGLAGLCLVLHPWLQSRQHLLAALHNGVNNFAEQHFSNSIFVKGSDELASLAQALNRLGDKLRRQHQSIYQRELLLDTVMQAAPTAILLCDQGGRVLYSNRAARDIVHDGAALNGHKLNECLNRCSPLLAQVFKQQKTGLITLDDPEQSAFHLTVSHFTINAHVHQLYLLKTLTQEINRQEVAVWKKVIRVISHELNNSLAPISSLAHSGLRLLDAPNAVTLRRVFTTIGERSAHLQHFIQGYARFAKLPAPQCETVPMAAFLASLQQLIPFDIRCNPPSLQGFFDPAQIQQALLNLLKNAHESGSPAGDIRIHAAIRAKQLCLTIEDGGPGMDEALLYNALLPFYSTKKSGAGLGLALCREIIDAHSGIMEIANLAGGGLTVSLYLPQKDE